MVAAGSITVAVRVRPPTPWEATRLPEPCYEATIRGDGALSTPARITGTGSLRDIVRIVDDRILTFDPDEKDRTRAFMERGFMPPGTRRYKDKRFMFDKVFDGEAKQRDVYDSTAKPLLKGLLDGFNATVFAYGATGCGKTHTISGTEADPGVVYLTMAELFQRIEDRKDEWNVETTVTFLEIYNEEIRDLLAEPGTPTPRGGLQIREDKTVKVAGLVELKPTSAEEVKQIVLQGNLRRTQSPTHANETSSRSHAVLQVHVTQSPRTAAVTEQRTMATLSIIDLAGSERAAATSNMGQRMVEGANINKSLLALGNCINALCESGGAVRHVPYRNSKLTRLLKFSLGGNCKTVMIVCVAPTSAHFDDTHNTLIYAERATKIKTKVVTRNVVNVDRHVGRYVEAINRLNAEVAELKAKLASKLSSENELTRRRKSEALAEVDRARRDMQAKADQTRASILDGASCSARLSATNISLAAVRARLNQLEAEALSLPSPELDAERTLLVLLAKADEDALRNDSALNTSVQRSGNATSMFEATLKAIAERRPDRIDEFGSENIKSDAELRKAVMEKERFEAERDSLAGVVEGQAQLAMRLVGMVARCTAIMDEVARSSEGEVAKRLQIVMDRNAETFSSIQGSTASTSLNKASLDFFRSSTVGSFSMSVSSIPSTTRTRSTRRTSSYGSTSPPSRKSLKSPRKSLRSSMAGGSTRRHVEKEKKGVQWKDEAGQGRIDDRSVMLDSALSASPLPPVSITVIPSESPTHTRNGSESDWEDEKTDESASLSGSFTRGSLRAGAPRRPRASRLNPSFLKSTSRSGSMLGSLAECDENSSPVRSSASPMPLGDRSMNSLSELHIPKGKERQKAELARRIPATPHVAGSSGRARRRSNIGPMRSEKTRRRSSMIPAPSPPPSGTGTARRIVNTLDRTPAKRPSRRASLLGKGSLRLQAPSVFIRPQTPLTSTMSTTPEPSGLFKPTWR